MGRELNVAGESGRRSEGRHVAYKNEEKRAGWEAGGKGHG